MDSIRTPRMAVVVVMEGWVAEWVAEVPIVGGKIIRVAMGDTGITGVSREKEIRVVEMETGTLVRILETEAVTLVVMDTTTVVMVTTVVTILATELTVPCLPQLWLERGILNSNVCLLGTRICVALDLESYVGINWDAG